MLLAEPPARATRPRTLRGMTIRSRRRASFRRAPVPAYPLMPPTASGCECSRTPFKNSCSSVGGWQVRLWMPCWPSRASTSPTRAVSTVKATRDPSVVRFSTPAMPSSSATGGASVRTASTLVRLRCRMSASVPVSTVRPARMMLTRSAERLDLAEDVAGEQHRAALAAQLLHARCGRPPPSAGPARTSARRAGAARRRRRARRRGRPSAGCPWSRSGPSWSGRARTAR